MRNKKIIPAALFAFAGFAAGNAAFAQNFPSLETDPGAAVYAERLSRGTGASWRDLAEAALWASTVNAPAGAAGGTIEQIGAAVRNLAAQELPRDTKARGEYVLVFMHKNYLKAYSEYQTRLDELLRTGRYNCVSSAVLYMILGVSTGLDVGGVMTKDHAFASIQAGGESIDVETTNSFGFDPGNRKEFHDGFGKATGFAYVPAKNYRDRSAIKAPELVSLILSNRIAELERSGRFAEAVPLAINREALLSKNPSRLNDGNGFFEDPRKDVMTRLFNYGAWLVKNGRDDDALAWAAYAGARFPDADGWQECIFAAMNNKAVRLIRARRPAEARAALEAEKPQLSAENYRGLDAMVIEAELGGQVNAVKNPGEAQAALDRIAAAWDRLPERSRADIRNTAVLKEGERLTRAKDYGGALSWINAAIAAYGSNAQFESALRTFRQNRVSELHNGFAALYNKRDLNGAKAFIEKALQEFPGERQLVQDRALVDSALKNG